MRYPLKSRSIAIGFAVACIVSALLGISAYWQTHELVGSFKSVASSHQTLEKLQSIQGLMEAAESSVCAFVITGQEDRLKDYRHAVSIVPKQLKRLDQQLAGHPRQKKSLQRLRWFLTTHLTFLQNVVAVRTQDGYESAAKWIAAENYASTRDEMEHLLQDIQKAETSVVQVRSDTTSKHSSKTKAILIFAAVMSLGLLSLVFALLQMESGQRRVVESQNQTLESFLQQIIERIPYMVLVKESENLRLTLVNKAATEWLGRSEQDLLGCNEYDLRPREEARTTMEQDHLALQQGRPVDIPEEVFMRGKEVRILHTQKITIPDEQGRPAFLLTISEDITEQKEAQRMLQLSRDTAVQSERLKSEFIRNMSHEIRTPISVFLGMTSLLMGTQLDAEQRLFAEKAQTAADGLSKLTKDILDFSKIETGTFTLDMQEMDLRQNVESAMCMWTAQAKTKGISLVSSIAKEIPAHLIGDPVRIRQVLTQLMSNAVKFTAKGEIILRVEKNREDDHQCWVTYEIQDTGIGIAELVQRHLFEPFRQGDGSPTRRYGGTGLGLAMAKRIVELMGGDIGFKSTPEKGSTFWFMIPFKKHHSIPLAAPSSAWAKARVLVIDDNEMVRQLLRHQLSGWALNNEAVSNGEAALSLLVREKKAGRGFAIVLLDMQLADIDGIAFARAVKNEPSLVGTQLLIMSNKETPLDPALSATLGIAGWVTKPPPAQVLHQNLAKLIEAQNRAA